MSVGDVVTISFKGEATAEPRLTLSIPIDDIQGMTARDVMWLAYTDRFVGSVTPKEYFGGFEICAAAAAAAATATTTTTAASPLNLDDVISQLQTRSFVIRKKSAGTYRSFWSCYGCCGGATGGEPCIHCTLTHALSLSHSLNIVSNVFHNQ
jgi:hypothetical protein